MLGYCIYKWNVPCQYYGYAPWYVLVNQEHLKIVYMHNFSRVFLQKLLYLLSKRKINLVVFVIAISYQWLFFKKFSFAMAFFVYSLLKVAVALEQLISQRSFWNPMHPNSFYGV